MSKKSIFPKFVSLAVVVMLMTAGVGCAQDGEAAADDTQNVVYALGVLMGQQISSFDLSKEELDAVIEGLRTATSGGEPKVDMKVYGPKVQAFAQARATAAASKAAAGNKEAGAKVQAEKAAVEGAVTNDSGLIFRILEGADSTGASPAAATARVKVHYTGRLVDGTVFDSSVDRGEPATFGLNQVIKCWTEGVQMMKVGQKAELVCPSDIAYGDQGRPSIPPGSTLIFEVELLEIVE